mgnify:CR=1 FL=1
MKRIMAALSLGLVASMAAATDITVEVEGKTVTVQAATMNRVIMGNDIGAGDQKTPLGCSLLYYALLAKGEIAEASTLSTDPKATAERWEQYKQRLGGEEFKKEMAAYFTSKNTVLAELTLGEFSMLVVKTPDVTGGQIYVKQDGKWLLDETRKTEPRKAFGKILSRVQNGEITF